jgi:hemerythrin-like metal-binding protein
MHTLFVWDEKYSVNVKLFDDQHKTFFDLINRIYSYIDQSATDFTTDTMITLLNKLEDYALFHLKSEEEFFFKYNYLKTQEHVKEHNEFRKAVSSFKKAYSSQSTDVVNIAIETADFCKDWLINHIFKVDKFYTEFFKEILK